MTTTIYQKFISKFAETFTLIEMTDGTEYTNIEIVPQKKLNNEELDELINELLDSKNEKATWED